MRVRYNAFRDEFEYVCSWDKWYALPFRVRRRIWMECGHVAALGSHEFSWYMQ